MRLERSVVVRQIGKHILRHDEVSRSESRPYKQSMYLLRRGSPIIGTMNNKLWWMTGALIALVVVVAVIATRAQSHINGACHEIATSAPVGDISIDESRGLAYLAYLDRKPNAEGKQPVGTIMLVDLNAKAPRVRAALVTDPPNFRPLGVSVYAPAQGPHRLFVLDAGTGTLAVHVFEQSVTGAFTLVETRHDSRLVNARTIVASGPDQFDIVNKEPWWHFGASSEVSAKYRNRSLIGSAADPKLMLCEDAS